MGSREKEKEYILSLSVDKVAIIEGKIWLMSSRAKW